MARTPAIIRLTEDEKNILSEWIRKGAEESQSVERARIILLSNEELTVEEIARHLQTRPARVSKWRQRFAKHRMFGLSDFQRSGKPGRYDEQTEKRVLDLLEQPPPEGNAQWNGRLLAQALGDVSQAQVWRILRRNEVQLVRRHSWSILTEPEFAPKAADIVGLYLDPPESALVLCVDEMPQTPQAEAAKGYLRFTNGKAAKNFHHRDRPDGTITLSEALAVMTAQLQAGQAQQRCRRQFLDFMNDVLDSRPGQKIHVVLNHLSASKPKWDRWLQRHSCVRLHFTPNFASWLNQAECWFSMLGPGALSGTSFAQPRELREAIEAFVAAKQQHTAPFEWAKILVPVVC
jgi:transposase